MRTFVSLGVVLLLAGTVVALDVPMRDGTVIPAESYRLTGSYIMIKLPGGGQVAYDAADVDLEALRAAEAAEAAATADGGADPAGSSTSSDQGTLVEGRSLKDAASVGEETSTSMVISDRDVRHVRRGDAAGDGSSAGDQAASAAGVPTGYQQGGGVVLNSLRVTPAGEGSWRIDGEVINRLPDPVKNVRVQLEATTGSGEPWKGEVSLASMLGPNETGIFQHSFAAEKGASGGQPNVRASVLWMQETTRREPDYTMAGGVPHPSNLKQVHGDVAGADVVAMPTPTPVE